MTDGDRNARLNDTRTECCGSTLKFADSLGEKNGSLRLPNLSTRPPTLKRTDMQAHAVEEDLILHVRAQFVAILCLRRQRDVEVIAPHVAANRHDLPTAEWEGVSGLEVECLRRQVHQERLTRGSIREKQVR